MSREMRRRVRRARKVLVVTAIAWGALVLARAAGHDMGGQAPEMSPSLMTGLSDHNHPIRFSWVRHTIRQAARPFPSRAP